MEPDVLKIKMRMPCLSRIGRSIGYFMSGQYIYAKGAWTSQDSAMNRIESFEEAQVSLN